MKIIKTGMAGTLESSDVMVTVRENPGGGINIYLQSVGEKQFGHQIKNLVKNNLERLGIDEAAVQLNDKGALDCTIEARLSAALYRAAGITSFKWEIL